MENYANLKCPHCGEIQIIDVFQDRCLVSLVCKFCGKLIVAPKGSDCVICAYSDKKCPISIKNQKFKKDILLILLIVGISILGFYFYKPPFLNNKNTNLNQINKQLSATILAKEGDLFIGNIYFNEDGYNKLLEAEKFINLEEKLYKEKLVGLDVWLPCCDFRYMQDDYSQNCGCGHHKALYGAAKILAKMGKSKQEIQEGIDKWRGYFFPEAIDKFAPNTNKSRGEC